MQKISCWEAFTGGPTKEALMTNLAIDVVLFFCVLAFVIGSVLAKAKRWPMMMTYISDEAEYWRKLAEGARREAERRINARSKQIMLKASQTYDRRANQATKEERGARIVSQAG
jgi:hypothetical protein